MKSKIVTPSRMFVLLMVFVAALLPLLVSNSYTQSLFVQVVINIVVVMGLNFITGLTGQMNLGTAGIFALGAYTSAILNTRLGWNPWMCLLASIVMGAVIGIGLGYPSLRVKGVYLSLTTIGFAEVVRLMITNQPDLTGGVQGVLNIEKFSIFGFQFNSNQSIYYLYLSIAILLVWVAHRIVNSKWGRSFKSIRDNSEASEALGINISSLKIQAFVLTSIYTCIAGSFYSHFMGYLSPTPFTMDFSINYVLMLIIGGIESVPGCILGAILVTLVPEILRFLQNYYWLVFSIITLLFIVFLPYGIVSLFKRKRKGGEQHVDSSKA
ncbi:branched-chain amino acid ABC transporter permease [Clostridium sp. KNHs216]|uniref:branched-chain amino acid ABC transporter permease n=1 Tax=Clostridium sp. KNHs216 TaxID=1550235 RepID=UPI00117221EC|nr:branched-chain amino acid ABC transporter permease [Clostridium sp. KNHs216]TQI68318.1 branched-chain amino acid transport system permease protein [Clostridium sp. KNHs216]